MGMREENWLVLEEDQQKTWKVRDLYIPTYESHDGDKYKIE